MYIPPRKHESYVKSGSKKPEEAIKICPVCREVYNKFVSASGQVRFKYLPDFPKFGKDDGEQCPPCQEQVEYAS